MKVFFIDSSLFAPSYNVQFCASLQKTGIDVKLLARKPRKEEDIDLTNLDFEPFFYNFSEKIRHFPKRLFRFVKGIEHIIDLERLVHRAKAEQPDVIHFSWVLVPVVDQFFIKRLRKICPLVLTVHNSVPFHNENSPYAMLIGHNFMPDYFDYLIPHTAQIRAHLVTLGVANDKMTELHHPLISLPPPDDSGPHLDGSGRIILFFGNIKHYKGVDLLVDAGLELIKSRPDTQIVIAGRAFISLDDLKERVAAAGAEGNFHFDQRFLRNQEIANYLDMSDIIVFPYREIDASGAFATASQCGKPIVTTDIGVFAEAPAKHHVLQVPREDVPTLTDTLGKLLDDPNYYDLWKARCSGLKDKMYTWRKFAGDCATIYDRVCRARHRQVATGMARQPSKP